MIFEHGLATFHVDSISKFAAGLKHRSQVRTQVTGQVTGHRSGHRSGQ